MDSSGAAEEASDGKINQAAFDGYASEYDAHFTDTSIGKVQRKVVHNYLKSEFPSDKSLQILEINGGTGEDACFFAEAGHQVLCTDASPKMVQAASEKAKHRGFQTKITHQLLDLTQLPSWENQKFDLIFSNFGGLNCLSPEQLKTLSEWMSAHLNPNGRAVVVVMPKSTLWELFYFSAKFKFRKAFRRRTNKPVAVKLPDAIVKTWYYNPKTFEAFFAEHFSKRAVLSTAISVPPSYMQPWINRKPSRLERLQKKDQKRLHKPRWAKYADHFIMDLSKKG